MVANFSLQLYSIMLMNLMSTVNYTHILVQRKCRVYIMLMSGASLLSGLLNMVPKILTKQNVSD